MSVSCGDCCYCSFCRPYCLRTHSQACMIMWKIKDELNCECIVEQTQAQTIEGNQRKYKRNNNHTRRTIQFHNGTDLRSSLTVPVSANDRAMLRVMSAFHRWERANISFCFSATTRRRSKSRSQDSFSSEPSFCTNINLTSTKKTNANHCYSVPLALPVALGNPPLPCRKTQQLILLRKRKCNSH